MPTKEDYRAKAEECLRAASKATDNVAASLLRVLADDYLELADRAATPVGQQQQQIQPKEPEQEDK